MAWARRPGVVVAQDQEVGEPGWKRGLMARAYAVFLYQNYVVKVM